MSSRSPKDLIKSKWGSRPSSSKSDTALEKFKGEIAAFKTSLDEITSGKGKVPDKDKCRLLEKIQVLEAEREKNVYYLTEKDREIQRLKDQLKARYSSSSLLEQLEEKAKECDKKQQLLESLSKETDVLKKQLSATTKRLSELEDKACALHLSQSMPANCFNSSMSSIHEKEMQLKDALEKNQQWLVYDQQREAYVKGLLAKIFELEKRAEAAAASLPQQMKKMESEVYFKEEKQKYDHLLENAKKDLEVERQTVTQLRLELDEFRRKYEESQKEVEDLNQLLSSQRKADIQQLEEDRHKTEKIQKLREESSVFKGKLEEEKRKSEELLSQVRILYESLLKHQEEQTRVALLEQQMQACTLDFENEKLDRQNMQHQLYVILKELRKARSQITQLESLKQLHGFAFPEQSFPLQREPESRVKGSSPKSPTAALNDSLVECPKCSVQYPANEHRDLLVHVEYCMK
uniref:Centrosomal protein of 55 kDa n=1 Tax=Peromyscus maniculatus bairdii TaxID=230844 RepID=A0A8C8T0W5_PERMB|nr:centrosomal protein of 55 kDa isoform X1 [Peromyscus maniculatus bairdii]XP_015851037.2 centrosomal protein of 55 kDa isoform X1 [Peromyscus maniculatus bairdii]XP_015851043.2 centrosomal protein of 55 kDa isoform X1 [Peromyscus maniculatus bairdii]XP_042118990.1 centrosomal protein of 55 kDa isoform X1 [Peromyscus maniculatus bairdii]XP_042118992.1 centrosomal protein of 55 kDa isoform X1 [Peromyscus maniculatus bairdii]XP_042118995.1 centrosomal protein of 55 kDa isoform X1 [Peromyscus ma